MTSEITRRAKTEINHLLTSISEEEGVDVAEKVQQIKDIISKDSNLRDDNILKEKVFRTIENLPDKSIRIQSMKILGIEAPAVEPGVLSIMEDKLEELGEELWDEIAKEEIKKFVIEREGEPIIYEERVLQQFLEKRPPLETLTEMYTLKFEKGKTLQETKANLLLCGEYFEDLFAEFEGKIFREPKDKTLDFSGLTIDYNRFEGILKEMKTGERDLTISDEEHKKISDYLGYSKWWGIPEGAFGPVQWETHYGEKLEYVPPVPTELLEKLDEPCPYFKEKKVSETHKLLLIPKGMTLNEMLKLSKNPIKGNKLEKGYNYYWNEIQEKYGDVPVEKSYWILMTTDVIPKSRGEDREKQLEMASSIEGYEAPSLLEAVICCFSEYVSSDDKKRLFSNDPWTYTCCREEPIDGYKLVVGGFEPAGLIVYYRYDVSRAGVAAVLRRKF